MNAADISQVAQIHDGQGRLASLTPKRKKSRLTPKDRAAHGPFQSGKMCGLARTAGFKEVQIAMQMGGYLQSEPSHALQH